MVDKKVSWHQENNFAIIVIDNPPANALSKAVGLQLIACLDEIKNNYDLRAVILTGAGDKFFVAGADISEFPELMIAPPGKVAKFAVEGGKTYNSLDVFPKPVIAAVNGFALGGGCELVLACDLCIASESAQFGLPEINLGLFPGGGGTQRLPRRIGACRAKELIFTGKHIKAAEALKIGLINRVVEKGKALDEAKLLASEIAARPAIAIELIKQCIDRGADVTLADGLKIESDLFELVFRTEDVKEGVSAFMEKRTANFKHR